MYWSDWRRVGLSDDIDVKDEVGDLAFERKAYESRMSEAFERVSNMQVEPLAHEGKRFLWSWEWGWRLPKS